MHPWCTGLGNDRRAMLGFGWACCTGALLPGEGLVGARSASAVRQRLAAGLLGSRSTLGLPPLDGRSAHVVREPLRVAAEFRTAIGVHARAGAA